MLVICDPVTGQSRRAERSVYVQRRALPLNVEAFRQRKRCAPPSLIGYVTLCL